MLCSVLVSTEDVASSRIRTGLFARIALAIVNDENLSLAIGKKGVNIRLASKLTKYKINVKTFAQVQEEGNK